MILVVISWRTQISVQMNSVKSWPGQKKSRCQGAQDSFQNSGNYCVFCIGGTGQEKIKLKKSYGYQDSFVFLGNKKVSSICRQQRAASAPRRRRCTAWERTWILTESLGIPCVSQCHPGSKQRSSGGRCCAPQKILRLFGIARNPW